MPTVIEAEWRDGKLPVCLGCKAEGRKLMKKA
jgi:hypothetical protein